MTNNSPRRAWINQPSTQQTAHKWHGVNVLATDDGEGFSRVYFTSGDIISARLPTPCLSDGWPDRDAASNYAKAVIARGPVAVAKELDRLQAKLVNIQRIVSPDSKIAEIAFR